MMAGSPKTPADQIPILALLMVLAAWGLLYHGTSGQAVIRPRRLTVAVEDSYVYTQLMKLYSDTALFRSLIPYVTTTGLSLNFTRIPISGLFENVSSAETVQSQLVSLGATAVISDYYISLAMATYSIGIPYFIIRKSVFNFPPPTTPNIFMIEIDNFHLSQALHDVSQLYKRTKLVIVSDGTPASGEFLVNFAGRTFSVYTVDNSSSDSAIYNLFARHNPNTLSSGMAWIMLFDEPNLPLMERTLTQASRAGMFVQSQFFFIPSLFDKQNYLVRFYRGDIEFYTFLLPDKGRYTRQELLYPFVLDCLNHYVKAYASWIPMLSNVTISNALVAEPTIQNPLTGFYAYDRITRIRVRIQLDVARTNRSRPGSDIFSLAGTWVSDTDGAAPYTPDYKGASTIARTQVVFAAFESEPYFYNYNSTSGIGSGLCVDIVEAMRAQLGFDYKVIKVGSQNEVIELLKNGSADVSLNFLAPSFSRLEFTDPSVDMVQDGIQMLSRKIVHDVDFLHVFHPFSFYVWMSIVLAIIILSATLYVCDKISPNTQGKPMYSPFESFYLVLSSFLMSKVETEPKKLSSKLFTLLLWFSTLLYMTTYLSNLVAFLIRPNEQVVFTTVGDLQTTKGYKWGYVRDSLVDSEVRVNWPRVYARSLQEWPGQMYLDTIDAAIAKVLADPTFILIASADTLSFMKNKDCKLKVSGNIANSHYLTWLFRRDYRFMTDLNDQLKSRKDTDFAQLRSKYFDLNRCYSGQTDVENKAQLDFDYLYGLFVLLGAGIVVGFLQLFGRWIIHRLRERRRSRGKSLHYKLGHRYQAEVYDIKPTGIWVRIEGDTEVRFLDNSCLNPTMDDANVLQAAGKANASLKGQTIEVQYLGNCSVSGAKIFVRHQSNASHGGAQSTTGSSDYFDLHSMNETSA